MRRGGARVAIDALPPAREGPWPYLLRIVSLSHVVAIDASVAWTSAHSSSCRAGLISLEWFIKKQRAVLLLLLRCLLHAVRNGVVCKQGLLIEYAPPCVVNYLVSAMMLLTHCHDATYFIRCALFLCCHLVLCLRLVGAIFLLFPDFLVRLFLIVRLI